VYLDLLSWGAEVGTTVSDFYDIKNLLILLFLRSFILAFTVLSVILQYSKGEKYSGTSRIALYTADLTVYEQMHNFVQKGQKGKWMYNR
jgi:hypothetical protein